MLPTEKFSGGSIQNLLLVFSIIGILLFIATILRLKVNFLRKAFVPVSLIAGIIGLILGPGHPAPHPGPLHGLPDCGGRGLRLYPRHPAPLLIACAASAAASVFIFLYLSPRIFKKNWFEVGITRFGASTGVAATGLMLLHTVDPDMKTDAAKIYALNAPFSSPFTGGGLVTSAYPVLIASFGAVQCGAAFMGLALLCVLGCRLVGCWNSHPQFEQRGNYTPPDDQ